MPVLCRSPLVFCRRSRRRAISLLEVLISMFVTLVGIVSLFSLIALGRFEMLEGSKADRAMSLARQAQREIKIRGILRPMQLPTPTSSATVSTWRTYDPSTGNTTPTTFGTAVGFAIDPLSIGTNSGNSAPINNFPPFINSTTGFGTTPG